MSNYSAPTKHPVTGRIRMADWLDDSFGRHVYGVRFHGEEKIYPGVDCVEVGLNEMLALMLDEIEQMRGATSHIRLYRRMEEQSEEIERLRAALREIEDCDLDPRLSRQSCVEQLQSMARAAIEGEKTND